MAIWAAGTGFVVELDQVLQLLLRRCSLGDIDADIGFFTADLSFWS